MDGWLKGRKEGTQGRKEGRTEDEGKQMKDGRK
jgi:hypothetical protein